MEQKTYNYYGDSIRKSFILGGLVMIISYPFFSSFIGLPVPLTILGTIALAVAGGLMNPKQRWVLVLSALVSVGALAIFEYAAVYTYLNLSPNQDIHLAFFWVNQLLSLIFFFASYLATKTLRGSLVPRE